MALPLSSMGQSLTATPDHIDCGQIVYRQPVTVEYKIKNTSTNAVTIGSVRSNCGCTTADVRYKTVAGDATLSIPVTFDARQLGRFEKKIAIYEEGKKEPLMLTLSGTVVQSISDFGGKFDYKVGSFATDKDEFEFDDVNRGDRPVLKFYVQNTTNRVLEPVIMHLPAWLTTHVSPSSVAPNHSALITLTLDSRKLRDYGLNQTSVFLGDHPGDNISNEKEINVSAVLLPDFDKLTDAQLKMAPKIKMSSTTLDLGSFGGKKKLKGEIDITNEGQTELDIQNVQMSTVGMSVVFKKTKIAPAETVKMKVTVDETEFKKSRTRHPRILMITNDPKLPKVVINILAK